MSSTHRWFPSLALAVALACTVPAWSQVPHSQVTRLLELAASSLTDGDLALANLRLSVAYRLDPDAVQAAPVTRAVEQIATQEAKCLNEGIDAAYARNANAVRQSVGCLRKLDRHSSAALEVVLRYQAALADVGGAFPRVRWEAWREAAAGTPDSPRIPIKTEPGLAK